MSDNTPPRLPGVSFPVRYASEGETSPSTDTRGERGSVAFLSTGYGTLLETGRRPGRETRRLVEGAYPRETPLDHESPNVDILSEEVAVAATPHPHIVGPVFHPTYKKPQEETSAMSEQFTSQDIPPLIALCKILHEQDQQDLDLLNRVVSSAYATDVTPGLDITPPGADVLVAASPDANLRKKLEKAHITRLKKFPAKAGTPLVASDTLSALEKRMFHQPSPRLVFIDSKNQVFFTFLLKIRPTRKADTALRLYGVTAPFIMDGYLSLIIGRKRRILRVTRKDLMRGRVFLSAKVTWEDVLKQNPVIEELFPHELSGQDVLLQGVSGIAEPGGCEDDDLLIEEQVRALSHI
jgi:hypothetical protein